MLEYLSPTQNTSFPHPGDWAAGKRRSTARPSTADDDEDAHDDVAHDGGYRDGGYDSNEEDAVYGDFEDMETGMKYTGGDAVTDAALKAIRAAEAEGGGEEEEEGGGVSAEQLRLKKLAKKVCICVCACVVWCVVCVCGVLVWCACYLHVPSWACMSLRLSLSPFPSLSLSPTHAHSLTHPYAPLPQATFDAQYDQGDDAAADEEGGPASKGGPAGPGDEETYYDALKREMGMCGCWGGGGGGRVLKWMCTTHTHTLKYKSSAALPTHNTPTLTNPPTHPLTLTHQHS